MLVFIDDAGDPGFKLTHGSSSVFVITLIIFDDFLEAEKCSVAIKELRRKLGLKDQYEFKFNKLSREYRLSFIDTVIKFKFSVRTIVVDKAKIYSKKLRTDKESFYNYTIMQVLKIVGNE